MRVASLLVVPLLLVGCEANLGQCDMKAATTPVHSSDGTPYYPGQALVQQSCAGSYCHVSTAVGANRFGVPHGLNFDVSVLSAQSLPANVSALQAGVAEIRDEANSMYGEIDDGSMPPGKKGERLPQSWTDAADAAVALDIRTAAGKDTVRNWLACGAPVVAGVVGAPAAATAIGDVLPGKVVTATPTFSFVYDSVLKGSCITCHVAGGAFSAQTPLDFTSSATAYASLFNKDVSTTGKCVGHGKLVVPGSCKTSLLYLKLQPVVAPATAVCGDAMPLGMPAIASTALDALCKWIDAGAAQQ